EILQEGLFYGTVIDANANILQPLFHRADFLRPQPPIFGYYLMDDRGISTRALGVQVTGPNDVVGAPGPLTILANYAPQNVTDVPSEIQDNLVRILVRVAIRKVTVQKVEAGS